MDLFNFHEDQERRGLSYNLWRNFPVAQVLMLRDLNAGVGVYPNLASFDSSVDAAAATVRYGSDGARIYVDASSTIKQLTKAQGGQAGGIRIFNTADNEEAWIQWGGDAGSPFCISDLAAEAAELVFEMAFRTDTITDSKAGFFLGLMEEGCAAANTITDAGALADKDYIGFHRLEGDGDTLELAYKKNGQTAQTVKTDWKTIAVNTWYHVGFRYNPINKTVRAYFGTGDRATRMRADDTNIITAANIEANTFPDGEGLAPIAGGKNASADDHNLDLRLVACGQRALAAA